MTFILEEAVGTDTLTFRSFIPSLSAQRSEFTHNTQTEHHGKMEKSPANDQNEWPVACADIEQAASKRGGKENCFGKRKWDYLCPDGQSGK